MQDLLYVSFEKNEKNGETGICIVRNLKDGDCECLKMELDKQAELLYKVLTDQSVKIKETTQSAD